MVPSLQTFLLLITATAPFRVLSDYLPPAHVQTDSGIPDMCIHYILKALFNVVHDTAPNFAPARRGPIEVVFYGRFNSNIANWL